MIIGLYVRHGDQRTKRMEFRTTRLVIGSNGTSDLVLRDGDVAPVHCVLSYERGRWFIAGEHQREIADGSELPVGDYRVVLQIAPPGSVVTDAVERELLDAISDDAARLVYADWLEERGHALRAEYLRLQLAPIDRFRLQALAGRIALGWRARVARGPIEGCNRADCPKEWTALAGRDHPSVRYCEACDRPVFHCENDAVERIHKDRNDPRVCDFGRLGGT
jgi:uncharacterized protein (TIGR02996 family)